MSVRHTGLPSETNMNSHSVHKTGKTETLIVADARKDNGGYQMVATIDKTEQTKSCV